ncbi:MAG: RNA polymerase subunit sigma-70 [Eubacteriales bacterium]|nr:RNA polymerase subunit sigma-70 [Eubacteriales bacterium]
MTDTQRMQIKELRLAGYGYLKIAKEIGVSENTVKSYCRRSKTNCKAQEITVVCEQCGETIDISKRRMRRFCSDNCRSKWWNKHPKVEMSYTVNCACCGKEIHMRRKGERKYCSHRCYIAARYKEGGEND